MPEFDATVSYRPIVKFPGYVAGSDGTVWSFRQGKHRQLKQYRRPYGSRYCVVCLRAQVNGKLSCQYVHRLVLSAFVGPCPPKNVACHGDHDTSNNVLSNLRWGTHKENMGDSIRDNRFRKGERSPNAKLTTLEIIEIHRRWRAGETQKEIGKDYQLTQSSVSGILRGRSWRHVLLQMQTDGTL